MNDLAFKQRAAGAATAAQFDRLVFDQLSEIVRQPIGDRAIKSLTFAARNIAHIGFAKPTGRFEQCVQHRLEIEG